MPIVTVWDNPEQTIIRKDFSDPWSWQEYAAALGHSHAMMAEHPDQSIAIILNMSGSAYVPPNPLPSLRVALRDGMPENWQVTVVVGGTLFVKSLAKIFNNGMGTTHQNVRVVNDLAAARELLGVPHPPEARE